MEMIRVVSRAMNAIGYNSETQQMKIEFKQGDAYTFCRVPPRVFDGLRSAASKGSYYDAHIRDKYQC